MSFSTSVCASLELTSKSNLEFCTAFINDTTRPKYALGRNIYVQSLAKHVQLEGVVDEFTTAESFEQLPVFRLRDLPQDAMVLNCAGGRPWTARQSLEQAKIENLDYFAFQKLSGLPLVQIRFNEGFEDEFTLHGHQYDWVHGLLADDLSKTTFEKLVRFRFSYDLKYLEGFKHREDVQYFEDFLNLQAESECFFDVGSFDGYTSLEFVKRCTNYSSIQVFEPDPANYSVCSRVLSDLAHVQMHPYGLSSTRQTLRFDMQGSSSKVSEAGGIEINVEKLDELEVPAPTFIKIDIEGGELLALEGAKNTIRTHHPKLAIAAYHAAGDFWKIPRLVLSIRDDYDVYMRHYTECIYESVLFFIPRQN